MNLSGEKVEGETCDPSKFLQIRSDLTDDEERRLIARVVQDCRVVSH